MDIRSTALSGLDLRGKTGLEIGPLDRPLVRRGQGRVYYADHCAIEALRAKYAGNPDVDAGRIVEIDFDLSTGRLPDVAADVAPFDYVVASHVAEHVPDLIGWLKDIQTVLRPGGVLALVLPDKRFTLDLHRRETPLHELETAHAERRTRPSLETVLDHFVNIVQADVAALWRDGRSGREARRVMPPGITAVVTEQWHAGQYLDAHCWVFTPWWFIELLGLVVERHELDFGLRWAKPTPSHQLEFYVQLERRQPGSARTNWTAAARSMRLRAEFELARHRFRAGLKRMAAGTRPRLR